MTDGEKDDATMSERFARVGVYSRTADAIVVEVTLPPRSSIIVGCGADVTVALSSDLGIERLEVIREGAWLLFDALVRVNVVDDASRGDHVEGSPGELNARGISSPVALRWARLKLTLQNGLSVFVEYLPRGVSRASPRPALASPDRSPSGGGWQSPYS
jgi:hypothetical protein